MFCFMQTILLLLFYLGWGLVCKGPCNLSPLNCFQETLVINYPKSKILLFTKTRKQNPLQWSINGCNIEQIKAFSYLGILFSADLSWTPQLRTPFKEKLCANAINRVFHNTGVKYISGAVWVFNLKVVPLFFYCSPIWIKAISDNIDQSLQFLRKALKVPHGVWNIVLWAEFVKIRARLYAFRLRLKLFWAEDGLVPALE